jgi:hypothetical protein
MTKKNSLCTFKKFALCQTHARAYKFGNECETSFQAWRLWKDGRLRELVDPVLGDGYELAEITQCARVALLCAQEDPADRPTMSDVAAALLNFESVSLLHDPKEPSQLVNGGAAGNRLSTSLSQSTSRTVDITITTSAPVSTRVRIVLDSEPGSL